MIKNKIHVVTGTRAEYGLLRPLIRELNNDKHIDMKLVVTGSHLSCQFGNTKEEIVKDGFDIFSQVPIELDGDTKKDMAISTGTAISSFAEFFDSHRPDIIILLGDRYEIFAAASAAAILNIPIAHIHGGEITEGAIDDFFRHSITKMSYIHFTACEEYAKRVVQLGEYPDRVFNVGALGVENVINLPEITKEELEESLKFSLSSNYSIVTFHPSTQDTQSTKEQLFELIKAMDRFEDMRYIITKSNADAGGRLINKIWDEEAKSHPNWCVVASLGVTRYLSALKGSCMMIGNSSSGIIEAPVVKIPTINIGKRQKGRMLASSVISCDIQENEIVDAMEKALSTEFRSILKNVESPFGNGHTSLKIIEIIKRFLDRGIVDTSKSFYDL